jgi:hypothetical protein
MSHVATTPNPTNAKKQPAPPKRDRPFCYLTIINSAASMRPRHDAPLRTR